MLVIKTGLQIEADVVRKHADPGALILPGRMTVAALDAAVPAACTAIISVGFCGGLRKAWPKVGDVVVAELLVTPDDYYAPNDGWSLRLSAITGADRVVWLSTGHWHEADTPKQRAALFATYSADCIDDESAQVAIVAERRNLPFAVMRVVTDGGNDNVSITHGMIGRDGDVDLPVVGKALKDHPQHMQALIDYFDRAKAALTKACRSVGPTFQAP